GTPPRSTVASRRAAPRPGARSRDDARRPSPRPARRRRADDRRRQLPPRRLRLGGGRRTRAAGVRGLAAVAADGQPPGGGRGRRLRADQRRERGQRARPGAPVHRRRLPDEPAHVRRPSPGVVRGRHLRAGRDRQPRDARPHPRARSHQRPVQAGHLGRGGRPARGAARRERGLPHAALRELDRDEVRGGRDGVDQGRRLPGDEREGLRRHSHLPHPLRRQGARAGSV
ncbi:MAG: hypothetical protein AVDCRST_MAG65-1995, partial [uncultured Solirubrobacteraceae bacterium]